LIAGLLGRRRHGYGGGLHLRRRGREGFDDALDLGVEVVGKVVELAVELGVVLVVVRGHGQVHVQEHGLVDGGHGADRARRLLAVGFGGDVDEPVEGEAVTAHVPLGIEADAAVDAANALDTLEVGAVEGAVEEASPMLFLGALEAGGLVADQGAHLRPSGDVAVEFLEDLVDVRIEDWRELAQGLTRVVVDEHEAKSLVIVVVHVGHLGLSPLSGLAVGGGR
jgi:hypothetical protein